MLSSLTALLSAFLLVFVVILAVKLIREDQLREAARRREQRVGRYDEPESDAA